MTEAGRATVLVADDEAAIRDLLREALDAFVDKTQETVTGSVTFNLYKGNLSVASRKSPC